MDGSKLIDLTHTLDDTTFSWPGDRPFHRREEACGRTDTEYWYALGSFEASEHAGTHMDSPIHFGERQAAIDAIPVARLISPAVVIDISLECAGNCDYQLSPRDLERWEAINGLIRAGTLVLARCGWAERWPDACQYLGTACPDDPNTFHFPGVSPEAADLLVGRRVHGVGIDTASLDNGPSVTFRAHKTLNEAGIYGLENLVNLHLLPALGATVIALPVKIRNGSGAPARVIAVLP
jgi:kynurenine formamidase